MKVKQKTKHTCSLVFLCSMFKWAPRSSVTRFGSPPGTDAQTGQIYNNRRQHIKYKIQNVIMFDIQKIHGK